MKSIKLLRCSLDMTLEEFAAQLNVAGRTVWRWENGVTSPTARQLQQISDRFNVSLAWLISEESAQIPKAR